MSGTVAAAGLLAGLLAGCAAGNGSRREVAVTASDAGAPGTAGALVLGPPDRRLRVDPVSGPPRLPRQQADDVMEPAARGWTGVVRPQPDRVVYGLVTASHLVPAGSIPTRAGTTAPTRLEAWVGVYRVPLSQLTLHCPGAAAGASPESTDGMVTVAVVVDAASGVASRWSDLAALDWRCHPGPPPLGGPLP